MDSLRQAAADLREWRADYEGVLRPLGLCPGLSASQSGNSTTAKSTKSDALKGMNSEGVDGTDVVPMDVEGRASQGGPEKIELDEAGAERVVEHKEHMKKITMQNLSTCIHAAEKIAIGRSLKDVREMRAVLQRANDWIEQCQSLCPRRQSKRRVQPSSKPTFDRLKNLIAEGLASPVGVADEVVRIRRHIAEAESCQRSAKAVLEEVCSALAGQTIERKEIWRKEEEETREKGSPSEESKQPSDHPNSGQNKQPSETQNDSTPGSEAKQGEDESKEGAPADAGVEDNSADDESDGDDREDELDEAEESNEKSLEQLLATARDITVFMPEELVAEKVQKIIEWARYDMRSRLSSRVHPPPTLPRRLR